MRRLGELDVPVFDDFNAITPGVEKVEERSRQKLAAGSLDPRTHTRAIIDDEPEMPPAVLVRRRGFHQVDELIAELDECVARPLPPKGKIENLAIKGEGLVDVVDFQGNMIDADEPWFRRVGLVDLGHAPSSCWPV